MSASMASNPAPDTSKFFAEKRDDRPESVGEVNSSIYKLADMITDLEQQVNLLSEKIEPVLLVQPPSEVEKFTSVWGDRRATAVTVKTV